MDRFTAYLLVRRHLKLAASRNRALTAEAIMEELAQHSDHPPERWGTMGLLSQLDVEYATANPDARGQTAREQAALEGLEAELGRALAAWCQAMPASPLEAALLLADLMAAALAAESFALEDEAALGSALTLELERQAGDRLDNALAQLALGPEQLVQLALTALRRIAGELR